MSSPQKGNSMSQPFQKSKRLKTDEEYEKKRSTNRNLQLFSVGLDSNQNTSLDGCLEDLDDDEPFDQFKANYELFGTESDYNFKLYTTSVKKTKNYERQRAEAQKRAYQVDPNWDKECQPEIHADDDSSSTQSDSKPLKASQAVSVDTLFGTNSKVSNKILKGNKKATKSNNASSKKSSEFDVSKNNGSKSKPRSKAKQKTKSMSGNQPSEIQTATSVPLLKSRSAPQGYADVVKGRRTSLGALTPPSSPLAQSRKSVSKTKYEAMQVQPVSPKQIPIRSDSPFAPSTFGPGDVTIVPVVPVAPKPRSDSRGSKRRSSIGSKNSRRGSIGSRGSRNTNGRAGTPTRTSKSDGRYTPSRKYKTLFEKNGHRQHRSPSPTVSSASSSPISSSSNQSGRLNSSNVLLDVSAEDFVIEKNDRIDDIMAATPFNPMVQQPSYVPYFQPRFMPPMVSVHHPYVSVPTVSGISVPTVPYVQNGTYPHWPSSFVVHQSLPNGHQAMAPHGPRSDGFPYQIGTYQYDNGVPVHTPSQQSSIQSNTSGSSSSSSSSSNRDGNPSDTVQTSTKPADKSSNSQAADHNLSD